VQEVALPEILRPAGYVCGWVGKWHLGAGPTKRPTQRGIDEFFGFLGGAMNYFNAQVLRNESPLVERTYLTDAFTREAVSFINRHATEPFFLMLAYNAPTTLMTNRRRFIWIGLQISRITIDKYTQR
jgi:arylsulfatase A-like enzyme